MMIRIIRINGMKVKLIIAVGILLWLELNVRDILLLSLLVVLLICGNQRMKEKRAKGRE